MAQVAAPGSQPLPQHHEAPHGKKRPADGPLDNEQRLSKRLDLLSLANPKSARLRSSIAATCAPPQQQPFKHAATTLPAPAAPGPIIHPTEPPVKHAPPPPSTPEGMQIEDTPHRIYISDLSAELLALDSPFPSPGTSASSAPPSHPDPSTSHEPIIIAPDIDKHISKIPRHVLLGGPTSRDDDDGVLGDASRMHGAAGGLQATDSNQIVLYGVPSSLSVPEERDGVRRMIGEARERVRARARARSRARSSPSVGPEGGDGRAHVNGELQAEQTQDLQNRGRQDTMGAAPATETETDAGWDAMDID